MDRGVWRPRSQRRKELRVCRKSDLRTDCWLGVQREGGDGGPGHVAKVSAIQLSGRLAEGRA